MSLRLFEHTKVRYPVLCVTGGFWQVSPDSGRLERLARDLWAQAASGQLRLPGVLVDADAQVHRLVRVGTQADERMFRTAEPKPTLMPILECDGPLFTASVQQVCDWVAIAASATGHFESSRGFGLPSDLGSAKSVQELLARLNSVRRSR